MPKLPKSSTFGARKAELKAAKTANSEFFTPLSIPMFPTIADGFKSVFPTASSVIYMLKTLPFTLILLGIFGVS